jgi:hypothetical protein
MWMDRGKRCLGLAAVAACAALTSVSPASAGVTLGNATFSSGGIGGCPANSTLIQTASTSVPYSASFDGVITSWSTRGQWSSVKFKVARLGGVDSFTIVGEDGPYPQVSNTLNTFPVRIAVRQGDAIGLHTTTLAPSCGESGGTFRIREGDVPLNSSSSFTATSSDYTLAISAELEADADHDGYGDETQDACPTNGATAGLCPLPTTLGETFTPTTIASTGDIVKTGALGVVVAAPADGVITSWSYQAGPFPEGTLKLKMFRPLGGNDYQAVGADQPRTVSGGALNTFATRIPVLQGDKIGIHAENMPVSSNASSAKNSTAFFGGDLAAGSAATFNPSGSTGRRTDFSAVLEADADGDGYGDTSQDACPTSASTVGPCFLASAPGSPPNTKLTKKPKAEVKTKKAKAKVKVRFASDPAGASFQCKLDKGKFKACKSPQSYKLKPGKHKIAVRAVKAGLTDPTPAEVAFKVVKKQ